MLMSHSTCVQLIKVTSDKDILIYCKTTDTSSGEIKWEFMNNSADWGAWTKIRSSLVKVCIFIFPLF